MLNVQDKQENGGHQEGPRDHLISLQDPAIYPFFLMPSMELEIFAVWASALKCSLRRICICVCIIQCIWNLFS